MFDLWNPSKKSGTWWGTSQHFSLGLTFFFGSGSRYVSTEPSPDFSRSLGPSRSMPLDMQLQMQIMKVASGGGGKVTGCPVKEVLRLMMDEIRGELTS